MKRNRIFQPEFEGFLKAINMKGDEPFVLGITEIVPHKEFFRLFKRNMKQSLGRNLHPARIRRKKPDTK